MVRSTCFKLVHDALYVNMYLFSKKIGRNNKCLFCAKEESIRHLFLECTFVSPLNTTVLLLFQTVKNNTAFLTERYFQFF